MPKKTKFKSATGLNQVRQTSDSDDLNSPT